MDTLEKVGEKRVVQIAYVLKNGDGELIESSDADEPLTYLHGEGQILPGLEAALEGKGVGDQVSLTVPPDQGYGEHDPQKVFTVPRDRFDFDVQQGVIVQAQGPEGQAIPLQVARVDASEVTLDGNHPLAGLTLAFEVEVLGIREATEEELAHGHAHTGHHHHH